MDQKLQAYLEDLILTILQSPSFVNFSEEQKDQFAKKVRDHFQNIIFDTIVDSMNDEQLLSIKDLPMGSPQMVKRIEEISSQIPNLAQIIEKRLLGEVEEIKKNPLA